MKPAEEDLNPAKGQSKCSENGIAAFAYASSQGNGMAKMSYFHIRKWCLIT
jgi:hypothetical protein